MEDNTVVLDLSDETTREVLENSDAINILRESSNLVNWGLDNNGHIIIIDFPND